MEQKTKFSRFNRIKANESQMQNLFHNWRFPYQFWGYDATLIRIVNQFYPPIAYSQCTQRYLYENSYYISDDAMVTFPPCIPLYRYIYSSLIEFVFISYISKIFQSYIIRLAHKIHNQNILWNGFNLCFFFLHPP